MRDIEALRAAVRDCRRCPLWEHATQAVFGEGRADARVVMVGEQPGDMEDREGRPFVGPAGRLLDRALEAAGIDRGLVYVTNAVKHFKWEARGKRRLHSKPNAAEVRACMPWLESELAALRPAIVVCLGGTAAQALLGARFRVTKQRGAWVTSSHAPGVLATVHPSSILRVRAGAEREAAFAAFVGDLRKVRERMAGTGL